MRADRRRCLLAGAAALLGGGGAARGQGPFPQRPVSLLVPFAPGGIADLTARAVGQAMAATLGQALMVDNRPGAGGIVASQAVAHAAPDGHTLLLMSNAHAVGASLFRKLPFDAQKDFAAIALLASFDLALFVGAGSRHRTLAQWLADARARPGRLSIGCISIGSTQHLAAELFKTLAGIDVLIVPYKATPGLLGALRGGEIDLAIEILGPWLGQLSGPAATDRPGVLRALAVGSAQRFAGLPEVPTVHEAGVPGFGVASWNALAAPAATPAAVIVRLNQAVNEALRQDGVRRQLLQLGVRPLGGAPEQQRQLLAAETRRWATVIKRAGIEPQ